MLALWWIFLIMTLMGYGIKLHQALEKGNSTFTGFVGEVIGATAALFLFYYSYLYLTQ